MSRPHRRDGDPVSGSARPHHHGEASSDSADWGAGRRTTRRRRGAPRVRERDRDAPEPGASHRRRDSARGSRTPAPAGERRRRRTDAEVVDLDRDSEAERPQRRPERSAHPGHAADAAEAQRARRRPHAVPESSDEGRPAGSDPDGQLGAVAPPPVEPSVLARRRTAVNDYVRDLLKQVKAQRAAGCEGPLSWLTLPRLQGLIGRQFRCSDIQRLGLTRKDLPALHKYEHRNRRVASAVKAVLAVHDLITFWDLCAEVCAVLGVSDWEELRVLHGPLQNPTLRLAFRLEGGADAEGPPRISTPELLEHYCGVCMDGDSSSEDGGEGAPRGSVSAGERALRSFAALRGLEPPPGVPAGDLRWLGVWARPQWTGGTRECLEKARNRQQQQLQSMRLSFEGEVPGRARVIRWLLALFRRAQQREAAEAEAAAQAAAADAAGGGQPPDEAAAGELRQRRMRRALADIKPQDVRQAFRRRHSAPDRALERVTAAARALIGPLVDPETWPDELLLTESSTEASPAESDMSERERRQYRATEGERAARARHERQKRRKQRKKERRLEREREAEGEEVLRAHWQRKRLLEQLSRHGVGCSEHVVQSIEGVLRRTPRAEWGSEQLQQRLDEAVVYQGDRVRGVLTADTVAAQFGGLARLALAAAAQITGETGAAEPTEPAQEEGWHCIEDHASEQGEMLPIAERQRRAEEAACEAAQQIAKESGVQPPSAAVAHLLKIEQRTLQLLGAAEGQGFESIGLGSFLAFAGSRPQLSDLVTAGLRPPAPRREALLGFARCAVEAHGVPAADLSEEQRDAVAAGAARYAGLHELSQSGFESAGALAAAAAGAPLPPHAGHLDAFAIASAEQQNAQTYRGKAASAVSGEDVAARIRSLPPLTELRRALQWDELLAPHHGPLCGFLAQHEIACAVSGAARLTASAQEGVAPAVEPEEVYVVAEDATPESFKLHLAGGNGAAAAADLVSLWAQEKGRGGDERLLSMYVQDALLQCENDAARLRLVRAALTALPPAVRAPLGGPVFLSPLRAEMPHGVLPLVDSFAASAEQRAAVLHAGCLLGDPVLRAEWAAWVRGAEPDAAPAHGAAVAAAAAVAALSAGVGPAQQAAGDGPPPAAAAEPTPQQAQGAAAGEGPAAAGRAQQGPDGAPSTPTGGGPAEGPPPEDIVKSILRQEFGVGADLTGEGKRLHEANSGRLGRAIERLASDLYSHDAHFVLELVQNADDNQYAPGVCPTVAFDLTQSAVILSNNELGFSERNVRALCDVGSSTKAKSEGYIGMKGIGFKSVFRVSDCPEVHSGGFHIRFDRASGAMGYIQPQWVGSHGGHPDRAVARMGEGDGAAATQIVLPLRRDLARERKEEMASKFDDIHPSLLLFLRKLRKLTIRDHSSGSSRSLLRIDQSPGLTEVMVNGVSRRWLVRRRVLDAAVPRGDLRGVQLRTELALAFPLVDDHTAAGEEQMVFAFLPLRSCGLHFVLQGDWILPSSREDVDATSPWNQWLRSEIPALFVDSLKVFREHFPSSAEALSSYFAFVPEQGSVVGFFRPLVGSIHAALRRERCMLAADGTWCTPADCALCPGALAEARIAEHVAPPDVLWGALHKRYLHPGVRLPPALQRQLHIDSVGLRQLCRVGEWVAERAAEPDFTYPGEGKLQWTARWLMCCHECLEGRCGPLPAGRKAAMAPLRGLRLIPLASGAAAALSDGPVFFPQKVDEQGDSEEHLSDDRLSLRVIDAQLLRQLGEAQNAQLRGLLAELGVREILPGDIVEEVLLPLYQGPQWEQLCRAEEGRSFLRRTVRYVRQHVKLLNEGLLRRLRDCITLELADGTYARPGEATIFMGNPYGNPHELETMWQKYIPEAARSSGRSDPAGWKLVSPAYVRDERHRAAWADFLGQQLGVEFFFKPKRLVREVYDAQDTRWAGREWPFGEDPVELHDWVCPALRDTLLHLREVHSSTERDAPGAVCPSVSVLRCIAEHLDQEWQTSGFDAASAASAAALTPGAPPPPAGTVPSTLVMKLAATEWLPTRHHGLKRPRGLLAPKPGDDAAAALLGDAVPLCACSLDNDAFAAAMGLRREVCAADVLAALRVWSARDSQRCSRGQMGRLYHLLLKCCERSEADRRLVVREFELHPLVCIPRHGESERWSAPSSADPAEEGALCNFLSCDKVWLGDPVAAAAEELAGADVLGGARCPVVCYWYPARLQLLWELLGIQSSAPFCAQVDFLRGAQKQCGAAAAGAYAVAALARWSLQIEERELDAGELLGSEKEALQRLPVFPVCGTAALAAALPAPSASAAQPAEPRLVACDLPDGLRRAFESSPLLRVLDPRVGQAEVALTGLLPALRRIFGVPLLSALCEQDADARELVPADSVPVHENMDKILPAVQRFVRERMGAVWKRIHTAPTSPADLLGTIAVRAVRDLRHVISLPPGDYTSGDRPVTASQPTDAFCAREGLYVRSAYLRRQSRAGGDDGPLVVALLRRLLRDARVGGPRAGPEPAWGRLEKFVRRVALGGCPDLIATRVENLPQLPEGEPVWQLGPKVELPPPEVKPQVFPEGAADPEAPAREEKAKTRAAERAEADAVTDADAQAAREALAAARGGADSTYDKGGRGPPPDLTGAPPPDTGGVTLEPRTCGLLRSAGETTPLQRVLMQLLENGTAREVELPRGSVKEKVGIRFRGGNQLQIRGQIAGSPAAQIAEQLPADWWLVACDAVPVLDLRQLSEVISRNARCLFVVCPDPLPADPERWLEEQARSPARPGSPAGRSPASPAPGSRSPRAAPGPGADDEDKASTDVDDLGVDFGDSSDEADEDQGGAAQLKRKGDGGPASPGSPRGPKGALDRKRARAGSGEPDHKRRRERSYSGIRPSLSPDSPAGEPAEGEPPPGAEAEAAPEVPPRPPPPIDAEGAGLVRQMRDLGAGVTTDLLTLRGLPPAQRAFVHSWSRSLGLISTTSGPKGDRVVLVDRDIEFCCGPDGLEMGLGQQVADVYCSDPQGPVLVRCARGLQLDLAASFAEALGLLAAADQDAGVLTVRKLTAAEEQRRAEEQAGAAQGSMKGASPRSSPKGGKGSPRAMGGKKGEKGARKGDKGDKGGQGRKRGREDGVARSLGGEPHTLDGVWMCQVANMVTGLSENFLMDMRCPPQEEQPLQLSGVLMKIQDGVAHVTYSAAGTYELSSGAVLINLYQDAPAEGTPEERRGQHAGQLRLTVTDADPVRLEGEMVDPYTADRAKVDVVVGPREPGGLGGGEGGGGALGTPADGSSEQPGRGGGAGGDGQMDGAARPGGQGDGQMDGQMDQAGAGQRAAQTGGEAQTDADGVLLFEGDGTGRAAAPAAAGADGADAAGQEPGPAAGDDSWRPEKGAKEAVADKIAYRQEKMKEEADAKERDPDAPRKATTKTLNQYLNMKVNENYTKRFRTGACLICGGEDHVTYQCPDRTQKKEEEVREEDFDKEAIGRWGEQFVYHYLRAKAEEDMSDEVVEWCNEEHETGAAYDLVLKAPDAADIYIEVKATVLDSKRTFEMSHRELQFAQLNGDRFHIYRVFSAGTNRARILVVQDPCQEILMGTLMVRGELRIHMLRNIGRSIGGGLGVAPTKDDRERALLNLAKKRLDRDKEKQKLWRGEQQAKRPHLELAAPAPQGAHTWQPQQPPAAQQQPQQQQPAPQHPGIFLPRGTPPPAGPPPGQPPRRAATAAPPPPPPPPPPQPAPPPAAPPQAPRAPAAAGAAPQPAAEGAITVVVRRDSPTARTGLVFRPADLSIVKHESAVAQASRKVPRKWRVQSCNGVRVSTIEELKAAMDGHAELRFVFVPPAAPP
eukprot:TRINITY_DN3159_c1_g1_i3.p1 TRINITY_DN3159_c1_g1~~TRINITY_DN3159_c1_g1_i3.p1  ORF type:complete len:3805 (+),score=1311.45 TRINITY_DN3159_c1_g1_i3:71-11485(+)